MFKIFLIFAHLYFKYAHTKLIYTSIIIIADGGAVYAI